MKNKFIFIVFFLIALSVAFAENTMKVENPNKISKDSSVLKKVIINTVRQYIDSLNEKGGGFKDIYEIYVVRIEDTLPPGNQCYFSLSYIMNRSDIYEVKPTHYFLVDNKIVLVRCHKFNLEKKIGLEKINDEIKDKAINILLDDSVLHQFWHYTNTYYFFYYNNGILTTKYQTNYDFNYWLNWNNLSKIK